MVAAKRKLLIVDDDPAFGRLLSGQLAKQYDLRLAANGEQALEVVAEFSPDAAIVDIKMPGMCGIQLIQRFRERPDLDSIPIIVLSVKSDYQTIIDAISAGSDEYHLKLNFSWQTITEALERVIHSRAQEHNTGGDQPIHHFDI